VSALPTLAESQGDPNGARYDRQSEIEESIEFYENELAGLPQSREGDEDRSRIYMKIANLNDQLEEL